MGCSRRGSWGGKGEWWKGQGPTFQLGLRKKFCRGLFLGIPTAEVLEDLLWEQLGPLAQLAAICPLEM